MGGVAGWKTARPRAGTPGAGGCSVGGGVGAEAPEVVELLVRKTGQHLDSDTQSVLRGIGAELLQGGLDRFDVGWVIVGHPPIVLRLEDNHRTTR